VTAVGGVSAEVARTPHRPAIPYDVRIRLHPLSVVRESDDSFIVGNAGTDSFIRVPGVATRVIAALAEGGSLEAVRRDLLAQGLGELDLEGFVAELRECGLVAQIGDEVFAGPPASTDGIWLSRVPPAVAARFFSVPAWAFYAACLGFSLAVLVFRPELRPAYEDFFFYPDPAVCLVVSWLLAWVLTVVHEFGHLVAARATGLGARFTVSRRFWFVVLETDLSSLWARPRRQRLQAFLAGMAVDMTVLAVCLALRLAWAQGWRSFPPEVFTALGLVVVLQTFAIGWQFFLVMRTDLYAVLVTVLGCSNLYRVKNLYLKKCLRLLSRPEAEELAAADPRDVRVARWFGWAYAIALVWAVYFLVQFFVPATVVMAGWAIGSLLATPAAGRAFWEAFTLVALAGVQAALPLVVFAVERLRTRRQARS